MEIATTTVSSRGQIVIPSSMRQGLKNGEKLILFQKDDTYILKKASVLGKDFQSEFARANKLDEMISEYESGKQRTKKLSKADFKKELLKW
jgi:AbrB family looped-hinge helix DNA binding protein